MAKIIPLPFFLKCCKGRGRFVGLLPSKSAVSVPAKFECLFSPVLTKPMAKSLVLNSKNMNFKRPFFSQFLLIIISVNFAGCGSENPGKPFQPEADESYRIVCTVGMITDVVRNVAGDLAEVEGLIAEGVDPHLYKPTRGDVVKLQAADVVFYNGLLLEGKMAGVLVGLASRDKPVKAVSEIILKNANYLIDKGDGSGSTDPHVWMDVRRWIQVVTMIAETLVKYDPLHSEIYQANAQTYAKKLEELDAYAEEAMATIPEEQRVLVTAHDAFNYMGRAYGIEVRGIQGISTESEAGVRDLEELVDFIVKNKIPSVFVETSVSDKNIHALIEGAKARRHEVVIGGKLFSDAMGAPGTYEGTYIGMIDHNVTTIANALGGIAKGFKRD